MATRFRVTYQVITEESAEQGDYAEYGYASPGGWKHDDVAELSLREAISSCGLYARAHGPIGGFEDCGRWFGTIDGDTDYRTGAETTYALHPPDGITDSSYRRLRRLLTGRV